MNPLLGLLGVIFAAIAAELNDQLGTVALPQIAGGMAMSHDPGTWFTTLYLTGEVLGMSISPWSLVTFTLRQFTLFAILLDAVSSVMVPLAPHIPSVYVSRFMQGFSGGLTIPLLMAFALRVLDPPIRLYGLAVYALTATFAPALGTTMAALWTGQGGWRFIYYASVPLCTVAALLVWYGMPQDEPQYDRFRAIDWRGIVLAFLGFGSLSIMLQQGDRLDWFNSQFITMLGLISVITLPLFVVNEWFHPLPLMRIQLLTRRNMAFGALTLFVFIIVDLSGSTLPNQFLQEIHQFRPEQSYYITAVIAASQLVILPALAYLLDFPVFEVRLVNMAGFMLVLAACIGESFLTPSWNRSQFYLWQSLQALGQPMIVMSLLVMSTNAVKGPQEAPFASALVNTPRAIAEAAGVWLIQLIQRWRGGLHYNRLADQVGQERFRLIQAQPILPYDRPPLLPDGQPSGPHSLSDFAHALQQQARVLTLSDAYLVMAGIALAMIVVVTVLPEHTLPPRLQLAKK